MDIDKELQNAQQRVEQGWDRNDVIDIIRRTLSLLNLSTGTLERHLVDWQTKLDEDLLESWVQVRTVGETLYEACQAARQEYPYEVLKKHYTQSRNLKESIDRLNGLIVGSPIEIIRLSKDLTGIVEKLLTMNDRVSDRYPDVGSRESDEWASLLSKEQLMTVLGWIEDNKVLRNES